MDKFKKALVIAAHPDDEVLGCGGTVSKLVEMGKIVNVLLLGGVTTSRYKKSEQEERWKLKRFRDEASLAAAVLGINKLERSDLADNRFDAIPLLDVVKIVEQYRGKFNPDLVLTHDYSDLNVDHVICHRAVMVAFRHLPTKNRFRIMTFESLSSTEYQDQAMASFRPNCYVDIKDNLAKKIEAMKCYKSELHPYPHPRSLEGVEYLARKRGSEVGLELAEAFRIVREVC